MNCNLNRKILNIFEKYVSVHFNASQITMPASKKACKKARTKAIKKKVQISRNMDIMGQFDSMLLSQP